MLFPLSLLSILTSLIVILLCCVVMARFRQIFDRLKIPIAALTVLGGLILYTMGYLPEIKQNHWGLGGQNSPEEFFQVSTVALKAIYSTCRVFILESDFNDLNENLKSNGLFVLGFSLVHILGVMLTVMTVLSLLGIKFLSRLKLLFARARQVYIFLGLNDASQSLIRSLKQGGKSRCFIVVENLKDHEEDESLTSQLKDDCFILIDHSWEEIKSLAKLRIPKRLLRGELHVFALSDSQNTNAQAIFSLAQHMGNESRKGEKVCFYINTADESIEKTLDGMSSENGTEYEHKVFSLADITARQLFETHPVHDFIPMDTSRAMALSGFTIFIAGLDSTGVEILRKSIYLGQFIGGSYRAILTDGDMPAKKGHLFNKFPELKNNYNIEAYDIKPGTDAFYELIEKNLDSISYIAVALENDHLNVQTGIEIQRLIKRKKAGNRPMIAVHVKLQEEYEHIGKSGSIPDIRFFGRNSDIFIESIIINESMDRMARKMNALFNSIYHLEPADNWSALDAFTKESNRSAASNISTKLRLLGLEMKETEPEAKSFRQEEAVRYPVSLRTYLIGERLDNLARQEHLRWNAFHFASGWTTWPLSQTEGAIKAKDLKNKRHACLVSWEELEDVTRRFNQNPTYQDLDYEQVKNIPRILEYAGYEVFERK